MPRFNKLVKKKTHTEIVESKTGHTLYSDKDHKKVRLMHKKLNGGTGFRGWTPNFFLVSH